MSLREQSMNPPLHLKIQKTSCASDQVTAKEIESFLKSHQERVEKASLSVGASLRQVSDDGENVIIPTSVAINPADFLPPDRIMQLQIFATAIMEDEDRLSAKQMVALK